MRRRTSAEAPGYDSFLDVVANLVGIMLILVILVGSQAKSAIVQEVQTGGEKATQELEAAVEQAGREGASLEQSVAELEDQVQTQWAATELRRAERQVRQTEVVALERQLEEAKQRLDAERGEAIAVQAAFASARRELEDLNAMRESIQTAARPEALVHRPTPLARTVFNEEMHFRLLGGNLTYVPLEELVERLKSDAPQKVQKLATASETTETVGPLGGFLLRYVLRAAEQPVETPAGLGTRRVLQFAGFVLIPVEENLGESVDAALAPGSRFRNMLAGKKPGQTTITIWVYPDSFSDFRRIQESLHQLGFLAAGRPLPAGQPISGSPDGSRSVAQ